MQNSLPCRHPQWRLLQSAVRYHTSRSETYYDILKVRNDCTNKEIRNAFVQLSKQFHPDVKGATVDPKQTETFVKISEAYQILSKPKLRKHYDQHLWDSVKMNVREKPRDNGFQTADLHRPWEVKPNFDSNPGPYYGVKGLDRVSNSKVAFALTALCIFGAMFGFASVKHSFTLNREKLDEKSAAAGSHHAGVRADAEKYGNEEQLRRMVNRMSKEDSEDEYTRQEKSKSSLTTSGM